MTKVNSVKVESQNTKVNSVKVESQMSDIETMNDITKFGNDRLNLANNLEAKTFIIEKEILAKLVSFKEIEVK